MIKQKHKEVEVCVVNDDHNGRVSGMFKDNGYKTTSICTNYYHDKGKSLKAGVKQAITKMYKSDLLVFTGGTDISASIYGETPAPRTDSPDCLRDVLEMVLWKEAVRRNIPTVGICRGAQLLNCLNGGTLIQHNVSHLHSHQIRIDNEGLTVYAPADHHQVMVCTMDADILGTSIMQGNNDNDPEVVLYEATKSLCHQPHPEWAHNSVREGVFGIAYQTWFFQTVEDLLKL